MKTRMLLVVLLNCAVGFAATPRIEFVQDVNRVNVTVDGNHFTSYLYGDALTKPVLWPLMSPSGITLTRGFPLEPLAGESNDHPHHIGLFFTYDKVNGEGFWNNTTSPPQIKHIKTMRMENGQPAILSVLLHWVGKDGGIILEENRDMTFAARDNEYTMDFAIRLIARDKTVTFADTKEGMFAIRVADWLKEDGGSGEYLNSEGDKKEAGVWGKRARWVCLEGQKNGKTVGIAIFNHPDSVNYPTWWHARAYGLFSANPLGQLDFQKAHKVENPQSFNLTLQPGQAATFKFRLLIYEGRHSKEQLEQQFADFAKH